MSKLSVGLIGARGHVGAELMRLIAVHPRLALAFVVSRELAGTPVPLANMDAQTAATLIYENLDSGQVAQRRADVVVLALPNDKSVAHVRAIDELAPDTLVIDLSADHRFDATWFYGLPELYRSRYRGERRISNPGCYATAMQLAIAPLLSRLDGPVQCFGVSGYSGAGTTPSDKNDPAKLADNLIPYALSGHIHEREVTRHLHHPVEFMPHVAAHFRGITMTVNMHLREAITQPALIALYRDRYVNEPLVRVVDDAPWVSRIANRPHVEIGGFALSADGRRTVVVATIDNLLKGAATQALQNINLALGYSELEGIVHE